MDETGLLKLKFDYSGPGTRGADLVETLLTTGKGPERDLSREEADESIAVLEQLQSLWFLDQMVEGGEMLASQVHSETANGIQELVQNADDQGATELRMMYRKSSKGAQLLVAHNGDPVQLRDVLLMAYALLSGSREDPERTGRFGIGLKTLNQIADGMSVHCPPFDVEISGGKVRRTKQPAAIKSVWSPEQRQTLFVLQLKDSAPDKSFFRNWLAKDWDASSMLFLRTLRTVELINPRTRKPLALQRLVAEKGPDTVKLDVRGSKSAERIVFRDGGSGRRWTRYVVHYPSPREHRRTHKALGATTPLGIAIPERGPSNGRLFAGLPLSEPSDLPFSLNAQFEINISRTEIREQPNGFNEWLLARLGDLTAAVALKRFAASPGSGWRAVPLEGETAGDPGGWLHSHCEALVDRVHERLATKLRLRLGGKAGVAAGEMVFEDQSLDGILGDADQVSLAYGEASALPKRHRDAHGRWRRVLRALGGDEIDAGRALQMLEWEEADIDDRGGAWLVLLAAAAIGEGETDGLWEKRWILTAGSSERLSPGQLAESGALLAHGSDKKGLATRLRQTRPLARAFVARKAPAQRVREWLVARDVLRRNPSDEDALSALARRDGSEPLDLRRDERLLRRLRDAFAQLPEQTQHELGAGIGRNILLRGYAYEGGKRFATPVTPSQAYLPSSIEKQEGWLKAAGKCAGIHWLHRDYANVLRASSEAPRLGAPTFLRALGAGVSPRLEPAGPSGERSEISPGELSALQDEELQALGFATHLDRDFVSPDLDRVLADLRRERKIANRRARARALFLCLHNNWREYGDRTEAVPGYYRYHWRELAPISATWLGRTACEPWLTSKERGLHPKAPRELAIDSRTTLAPLDPSQYAHEIDADHADSPAAEALGIGGRTQTSDLVDALVDLRGAGRQGAAIEEKRLAHIYSALSTYCPNGENEARANLSVAQLQARFGRPSAKEGLVFAAGKWLPPARARRGDWLGVAGLPWVDAAPHLWDALKVPETDIADCVGLLEAVAADGGDRASEMRIFRRLLKLVGRQRKDRKLLRKAPLRIGGSWSSERPIFAVPNPAVAQSLAGKLPIWKAPLPLDDLAPLLPLLGVDTLDESSFEPRVSTRATAGGVALRPAWGHAVAHLSDFLTEHRPELQEALSSERWRALADCELCVGSDWTVWIPRTGKRGVSVQVPAYLFDGQTKLFCTIDEDAAGSFDSGGQAVASFFPAEQLDSSDRAFLAMAWERSFQRRDEMHAGLNLTPESSVDPDTIELPHFGGRKRSGKPSRGKRKGGAQKVKNVPVRELWDPADIDLGAIKVLGASGGRRGKLRIPSRRPLSPPDPNTSANGERTPTGRTYGVTESEEVGYRLMERYLAERGIELDDTRAQRNTGADGVDLEHGLYFELKAHGREASNEIRLQGSEAERAEEKGKDYWLVIAANLERGLEPELLFIPDPLTQLDTYYGGGIRLIGINSVTGTRPPRRKKSE